VNPQDSEKLRFIQQYGSFPLAYSALQQGIKSFNTEDGIISYRKGKLGLKAYVLGDPIANKDRKRQLLEEFVANYRNPVFVQISDDAASMLSEMDWYVNRFGIETFIDLPEYDTNLKGSKFEFIRRQIKAAHDEKITIEELSQQALENRGVSIKDVKSLSDEWIKTRKVSGNELSFMVRPAVFEDEPDVRKFYAFQDDALVGFAFFDPLYQDGATIGYYADIHRNLPSTPKGTSYLLAIEAAKQFKDEGKQRLELGISVLSHLDDPEPFPHSSFTKAYLNWSYRTLNDVYNFKGLEFHKQRFRGKERTIYYASKNKFTFLEITDLYLLDNINVFSQVLKAIPKWINSDNKEKEKESPKNQN